MRRDVPALAYHAVGVQRWRTPISPELQLGALSWQALCHCQSNGSACHLGTPGYSSGEVAPAAAERGCRPLACWLRNPRGHTASHRFSWEAACSPTFPRRKPRWQVASCCFSQPQLGQNCPNCAVRSRTRPWLPQLGSQGGSWLLPATAQAKMPERRLCNAAQPRRCAASRCFSCLQHRQNCPELWSGETVQSPGFPSREAKEVHASCHFPQL